MAALTIEGAPLRLPIANDGDASSMTHGK